MSLTLTEDTNLPCRVTASPACQVLVETLKLKDLPVEIHVGLVPCTFYMSHQEMNSLGGPVGRYGPMGPMGPKTADYRDPRPPYPCNEQVISIKGKCRSMAPLPTAFKVARGAKHNDVLNPLTFREIMSVRDVKRGWYKKPGFNVAYAALRAMIPDLTELEFACFGSDACDEQQAVTGRSEREHNRHLVEERIYTGETDCIESYEHKVSFGIQVYNFTLTCLDVDLEENTPDILQFLEKAMVV